MSEAEYWPDDTAFRVFEARLEISDAQTEPVRKMGLPDGPSQL